MNKGENKLHANTQIISVKMFNSRTAGKFGMTARRRQERSAGCRQSEVLWRERKGGGVCQVTWLCLRLRFVNGSAINSSKSSVNPFYDLRESRSRGREECQGGEQGSPVRRSKEKNSLNVARAGTFVWLLRLLWTARREFNEYNKMRNRRRDVKFA